MINRFFLFMFILFVQGGFSQTSLLWNKMYPLDSAGFNTQFTTAQKVNQNIVVGANIKNPLNNSDFDPLVLEYDINGNLVLNWSNQDSSINENSTNVRVDTAGMIYILTDCYEYLTNKFISTLVKLNPATQQVIFRLNFPTASTPSDFLIADNKIYLFQTNPINEATILDLQGNILQSVSIPYLSRIQKLLASREFIYIIGDTAISPNFVLKFEKLDFLANSISSYTTVFQNVNIGDAVINNQENLLFTGATITGVIAIKLDSVFDVRDTAFTSTSSSQSCGLVSTPFILQS